MKKVLVIQAPYRVDYNPLKEAIETWPDVYQNQYNFLQVTSLSLFVDQQNHDFRMKIARNEHNDVDVVYVKWLNPVYSDWITAICFYYNKVLGAKLVSESYIKYMHSGRVNSKLVQLLSFYDLNVRIPRTMFMSNDLLPEGYEEFKQNLGDQFVIKSTGGSKGNNNFLIKNIEEYQKFLSKIHEMKDGYQTKEVVEFVAQEFIPNFSDYRVFCLGYEPAIVIKRTRKDHSDHRNNISLGADGEFIDLKNVDPKLLEISRLIAKSFAYGVCGVDIIEHAETKELFVLEVNSNPNLLSPVKPSPKMVALDQYLLNL